MLVAEPSAGKLPPEDGDWLPLCVCVEGGAVPMDTEPGPRIASLPRCLDPSLRASTRFSRSGGENGGLTFTPPRFRCPSPDDQTGNLALVTNHSVLWENESPSLLRLL